MEMQKTCNDNSRCKRCFVYLDYFILSMLRRQLNFICKIPFFYFLCSFIYSPDSLKLPFISSFSSESISLASFNESIVVSFPFFAYSISFSRMLWRLLRYVKKVITKQTIPINQASVKSNIKPITIEESTYHACY